MTGPRDPVAAFRSSPISIRVASVAIAIVLLGDLARGVALAAQAQGLSLLIPAVATVVVVALDFLGLVLVSQGFRAAPYVLTALALWAAGAAWISEDIPLAALTTASVAAAVASWLPTSTRYYDARRRGRTGHDSVESGQI